MRGGTSIIEKIGTIVLCVCVVCPPRWWWILNHQNTSFFKCCCQKKMDIDEVLFQEIVLTDVENELASLSPIIVINLLSRTKETPLTLHGGSDL